MYTTVWGLQLHAESSRRILGNYSNIYFIKIWSKKNCTLSPFEDCILLKYALWVCLHNMPYFVCDTMWFPCSNATQILVLAVCAIHIFICLSLINLQGNLILEWQASNIVCTEQITTESMTIFCASARFVAYDIRNQKAWNIFKRSAKEWLWVTITSYYVLILISRLVSSTLLQPLTIGTAPWHSEMNLLFLKNWKAT